MEVLMASVTARVEYDAEGMPILEVIAEADGAHPDLLDMIGSRAVAGVLRLVDVMTNREVVEDGD